MRIFQPRTLLLAIAALFSATKIVCAADLIPLKSLDGGFTASFPAQPTEKQTPVPVGELTLFVHTFGLLQKDGREFDVIWSDYPTTIMKQTTPERIYAGIINGYNSGQKKLISDKPITVNGYIGHDLEVDMGNGTNHRTHLFLVDNRLYEIMTYAPVALKDDPEITKFLDSLSIINIRNFPARGFRIEGAQLAGWTAIDRDKSKTVAQWISPDSKPPNVRALITIEAAQPANPSLDATAASFAATWHGQVSPEKLLLDGEPAQKIVAQNQTPSLQPVEAIVTMHQGFMYLVMGGVVVGHDCSTQMDEIIKGWKWEPRVPAAEHLEFMLEPMSEFDGLALLNYPKDMYRNKTEDPTHIVDLSLYDLKRNVGALQAYVQLTPLPPNANFDLAKETLLKGLNGTSTTDSPLQWVDGRKDASHAATNVVHSKMASEEAKQDAFLKFALIQLDPAHLVLINFTIFPVDDKERARYEAATEGIIDSVKLRTAISLSPSQK